MNCVIFWSVTNNRPQDFDKIIISGGQLYLYLALKFRLVRARSANLRENTTVLRHLKNRVKHNPIVAATVRDFVKHNWEKIILKFFNFIPHYRQFEPCCVPLNTNHASLKQISFPKSLYYYDWRIRMAKIPNLVTVLANSLKGGT